MDIDSCTISFAVCECSGEFPLVVASSIDEAKASMQEAMSRTAEACFSGRDTHAGLHHDATILVSLFCSEKLLHVEAHSQAACLVSKRTLAVRTL